MVHIVIHGGRTMNCLDNLSIFNLLIFYLFVCGFCFLQGGGGRNKIARTNETARLWNAVAANALY